MGGEWRHLGCCLQTLRHESGNVSPSVCSSLGSSASQTWTRVPSFWFCVHFCGEGPVPLQSEAKTALRFRITLLNANFDGRTKVSEKEDNLSTAHDCGLGPDFVPVK